MSVAFKCTPFLTCHIPVDTHGEIFPNDEFYNNGPDNPGANPTPESTSGYGSSPADLLDQVTPEPALHTDTVEFSTETVTVFSQTQTTPSDNEPTQADADSYMTSGDALTESTGM